MNIGLIDVDGHNFPNLDLMRISSYHKSMGDTVEWWWGFGATIRLFSRVVSVLRIMIRGGDES